MIEKFTLGEWKVNEKTMQGGNLYRYGFEVVSPDNRKRVCYSETDEQGNVEQMQANAALIASAPDMYWMLLSLQGDFRALAINPNVSEQVKAVAWLNDKKIEAMLKKARGEA